MKWIDSLIETMNVFKQIFMHSVAYFKNYNKHICWLTVILSSSNMSAHQITFRRVSPIYWFYAPQLNVEPRQLVKPPGKWGLLCETLFDEHSYYY